MTSLRRLNASPSSVLPSSLSLRLQESESTHHLLVCLLHFKSRKLFLQPIMVHLNKHILNGFAGGKFQRYKKNKQLHPHGEGMGMPKVPPAKKSDINRSLLSKLQIRNKILRYKIRKHPKSPFSGRWKTQYETRKKEIALMV